LRLFYTKSIFTIQAVPAISITITTSNNTLKYLVFQSENH